MTPVVADERFDSYIQFKFAAKVRKICESGEFSRFFLLFIKKNVPLRQIKGK